MTRRRLWRALAWGLGSVILGAIILGGGAMLWLAGTLPVTTGELRIPALSAEATITRDRNGVVRIEAANPRDAQIALGFAHAQDRLWQMDMQRRLAAGRLAEILGARALPSDRFMRTLGLARLVAAQRAGLDPAVRTALEAYAAGVNAVINGDSRHLPPEFRILGYDPEPWQITDSLLWGRIMAVQLSQNMRDEILRARLLGRLGPDEVAALWENDDPDQAPTTLASADPSLATMPLARLAAALPESIAAGGASNSWAIAGRRTASGAPLLANDPHLGLQTPGVWYLARLSSPQGSLAGATAPGVPFLVLGHNGRVAWAMTTTHGDTMDLFIERVDPTNPARYLTPDGPRPFTTRAERIGVRGGPPEVLTVRETRHGPVISDITGSASGAAPDGHVLALAATALLTEDGTPAALLRMNQAADAGAFLAALEGFDAPQQNITFADIHGQVGFAMPARIPIRREGDGLQPVPGWDGRYDWAGFVPFAERPMTLAPPSELLVNANNRIVTPDYPYAIARYWPPAYRAARITAVLGETPTLDPGMSALLQMDSISLAARALLPALLAASDPEDRLVRLLGQWGGAASRDRPEALIFNAWLRALHERLFADDLGDVFADYGQPDPRVILGALGDDAPWCDDSATPETETCITTIRAALESARASLSAAYGGDPDRWRWGDAHRADFRHALLRFVPGMGSLFGRAIATDGDDFTVNRASPTARNGKARFDQVHGAGLRAVYDLADLDRSRFMIAPGQSGHPLSPHFVDLVGPWRDGAQITLEPRREVRPSDSRLRLSP